MRVRELERVKALTATYLQPEANGLVDLAKFKAAIQPRYCFSQRDDGE